MATPFFSLRSSLNDEVAFEQMGIPLFLLQLISQNCVRFGHHNISRTQNHWRASKEGLQRWLRCLGDKTYKKCLICSAQTRGWGKASWQLTAPHEGSEGAMLSSALWWHWCDMREQNAAASGEGQVGGYEKLLQQEDGQAWNMLHRAVVMALSSGSLWVMFSGVGFEFWVVLCGVRNWTWLSLWISSKLRYSNNSVIIVHQNL